MTHGGRHHTPVPGRLLCRQPAGGHRYAVDAVLLAHFVTPGRGPVVELGCGCGVTGLILAHRSPQLSLTMVEIQPELAACARDNVRDNRLQDRVRVVEGDLRRIRDLLPPECAQLVVANPPYGRLGTGRLSPVAGRDIARHELAGSLDDFLAASAYLVKNRGQVAVVFIATRLDELLARLAAYRLTPKRLRMVHGYPTAEARQVLVAAVKNGGAGLRVAPPLFLYQEKNGAPTAEYQAMLDGGQGGGG